MGISVEKTNIRKETQEIHDFVFFFYYNYEFIINTFFLIGILGFVLNRRNIVLISIKIMLLAITLFLFRLK